MPHRPTLLAALVLDAQEELLRVVDAIPAPGRHGRLGRLNAPGWALAHASTTHEGWLMRFCANEPSETWGTAWHARQRAAGWDQPLDIPLDEALDAYRGVLQRTTPYLASLDASALREEAHLEGTPWGGEQIAYLVARAAAHLFVHCGEISVAASLVQAGDMGLPGALSRTKAASAEPDESVTLVAALAGDARAEFTRIAEALPAPARGETLRPRLSAGAAVVAHVARGQDLAWNAERPDAWLTALGLDAVEPNDAHPHVDWDEAMAAWARVRERSAPHVEEFDGRANPRHAIGLAWTAAHLWAHTGELQAIGSLVGMPDMGLPGALARMHAIAGPDAR